jgi:hypothetical protein
MMIRVSNVRMSSLLLLFVVNLFLFEITLKLVQTTHYKKAGGGESINIIQD